MAHRKKLTPSYMASLEKRFWAQVVKTKECWLWTGYVGKNGRGYITARPLSRKGPIGVHRLSWRLHFGTIPRGLHVCHACDNPVCVRPDHLFVGTAKDNCDDKVRKGRMRHGHLYGDDHPMRKNPDLPKKGEDHPMAKLTERQVKQIRKLMAHGASRKEVAHRFGISLPTVSAIVHRRIWRHV